MANDSIWKNFWTACTLLALILCLASASRAQSTLTDDANTANSPKDMDTNFGTNPNLIVSSINNTYLKFKLSPALPPGRGPTALAGAGLAPTTLRKWEYG